MKPVGAVILCGGESRRMGTPKAWLRFGNEVMLQRVVRLVGESASPVVVVAAPGQDLPDLPTEVMVVRDRQPGRGPLQGLADGLAALPTSVEYVYVTGTDAPFLAAGWISRLAELIGDHDLAIVEFEGFLQPLAALYRREFVIQATEGMLKQGQYRLGGIVDLARTLVIRPDTMSVVDPNLLTLYQFNTLEEYRQGWTVFREQASLEIEHDSEGSQRHL